MRIYDIIYKKRNAIPLDNDEINFVIQNYSQGIIPDYQMSALLMAIFLNGMNDDELASFTLAMANSGDIVDLSSIDGIKVDKHSTGGVGDKTTLIIAPIVAYHGVKVAKMSGRGLGHTGGTVDKLESIPNFKTSFTQQQFFDIVNKIGVALIGQSTNLAPADKKLYALRDVTATVESIPLIASSIMSKKIASGSDCILLDIKVGSGAFMKTFSDSLELAQKMVSIGESCSKKTIALITDMDIPLGNNIGNSLEIIEVIETLKGNGPHDLTEISIELASNMLYLANLDTLENCKILVRDTINSGAALPKFTQMIEAQGGDINVIDNYSIFPTASHSTILLSTQDAYIFSMNTEALGIASTILGAGRNTQDDIIDYSAGIILNKKVGDFVKKGDVLATFFSNNPLTFNPAKLKFLSSLEFSSQKPRIKPLVFSRIEKNNISYY